MRTLALALGLLFPLVAAAGDTHHYLYVATPGVRADVQYGGVGVLIFDIDDGHKFVRRIAVPGLGDEKHPEATKGICDSAVTGRLYVSTPKSLSCLDLSNDKLVWQKSYEGGCDRMSISPDGKTIYEPTFEGKFWHVINAKSGEEIAKVDTGDGAHNTVFGRDGLHAYLAGLKSPVLGVADVKTNTLDHTVGPFGGAIRPFTVDGKSKHCFVCVNDLLGFDVGDLASGKKIHRVEVDGFSKGGVLRHGCPSHGIGLMPDEKELWLTDAHNRRLHIFDNTVMPPKQVGSVELRDEPGWVTFSIDGRFAYPSTGEIVDVKARKVIGSLKDEAERAVQSEKLLELDFSDGKASLSGDQFGIGRVGP